MNICIIDTTIFCALLNVPNRSQNREEILRQLEQFIDERMTLLLPLSVIIETGNHIAQNGDGNQRRIVALEFVKQVQAALQGNAPWKPTPFPATEEMMAWINEFPDSATRGIPLADLTIIKEFNRQCLLNPRRRIFIWSGDEHLAAYDRTPGNI